MSLEKCHLPLILKCLVLSIILWIMVSSYFLICLFDWCFTWCSRLSPERLNFFCQGEWSLNLLQWAAWSFDLSVLHYSMFEWHSVRKLTYLHYSYSSEWFRSAVSTSVSLSDWKSLSGFIHMGQLGHEMVPVEICKYVIEVCQDDLRLFAWISINLYSMDV